jgi:hypothetical protein
MMRSIVFAFACLGLACALHAGEPKVIFEDTFDGKLADGWTWLRENPATHRIKDRGLEIRVEPGVADNVKNALVRPAPDRAKASYAIEVTITFTAPPTNQYEQAGITWYQKGRPIFKMVHEHVDGNDMMIPGRAPAPEKTVQLRLVVAKETFTAQYRIDAKGEFKTAASGPLAPGEEEQLSLQCYQGPPNAEHWIRFENFRITKLDEKP